MTLFKVILADDHVRFRQGLKKFLSEVPDLEVVGEVGDGLSLLEMLSRLTPDLVIMSISMPKLSGLEATQRMAQSYPQVKVLILAMHKDPAYLQRAMELGAHGYLPKDGTSEELLSAIDMIRTGETYISPLMAL